MAGYTDSELEARWEHFELNRAAGMTPELEHEELTIRREWAENYAARVAGKMTDDTARSAVDKAIHSVFEKHATVHRVEWKEWLDYLASAVQGEPAWDFECSLMHAGPTAKFNSFRWESLIDLIDEQIRKWKSASVTPNPSQFWGVDEKEIPPDYDERDYSLPGAPFYLDDEDDGDDEADDADLEEEDVGETSKDPYLRRFAVWTINTHVWDGPPPDKANRRPPGAKPRS